MFLGDFFLMGSLYLATGKIQLMCAQGKPYCTHSRKIESHALAKIA